MEFNPIKFTRTDDSGERTLIAYTPAQAVKLRFDGWTEQKDPDAAPPPQIGADGTEIQPDTEPDDEGSGSRRSSRSSRAK